MRLQSGLRAKENEYRCEGISQAHPGYWLAYQVPPISSAFSISKNEVVPASRSLMAIPSPENPAPTIRTSSTPAGNPLAEEVATVDCSRVGKGSISLPWRDEGRKPFRASIQCNYPM